MDIPTEWLSSQLILGAVLIVLVVVGVIFFFRVGARQAPPAGPEGQGAGHDGHDHEGHDHDVAGPSGPGTYGPITPVASASVFETEPCWVSLLPGRARATEESPASDAPAPSGAAAPDETAPAART